MRRARRPLKSHQHEAEIDIPAFSGKSEKKDSLLFDSDSQILIVWFGRAKNRSQCGKAVFPGVRKVRGPAGIIRQLDPKRTRSGEIS